MDKLILGNKDQFPTEEIIFSHIGKSKTFWKSIFRHIQTNHPDLSKEWKYYNDGKSWLLKITKKSKTIFWLSVIQNSFKITFYFGDKAEQSIMKSPILDTLKKQFKEAKRFGKIRGITIIVNNKENIASVKDLVKLKISIK